jgi:hypothetical protein
VIRCPGGLYQETGMKLKSLPKKMLRKKRPCGHMSGRAGGYGLGAFFGVSKG